MKLVWNQVMKDVRRFWPLLFLWWLLLAWQATLIMNESLRETGTINMLLLFVLTVLVILEDPVVGHRAFWLTRPLSAGKLLTAKGLFLSFGVVVPSCGFQLVALYGLGLDTEMQVLVIGETLLRLLATIGLFAVLAALSSNLGTLVAVMVVGFVALALHEKISRLFQPVLSNMNDFRLQEILQLVGCTAGAGLVLCHQYLTRQTRRSAMLVVVIAILVLDVSKLAPWELQRSYTEILTPEEKSAVTVLIEPGIIQTFVTNRGRTGGKWVRKNISGDLRFEGLPSGHVYEIKVARSVLRLETGKTLRFERTNHVYFAGSWASLVAGQVVLEGAWQEEISHMNLGRFKERVLEKYSSIPGRLELTLQLTPYRVRRLSRVPLVPGSFLGERFKNFLIEDVDLENKILNMKTSFYRAYLLFRREELEMDYLWLEPEGQEYFPRCSGSSSGGGYGEDTLFLSWWRAAPMIGISARSRRCELEEGDPEWLEKTHLLFYEKRPGKSFNVEATLEDFSLEDYVWKNVYTREGDS